LRTHSVDRRRGVAERPRCRLLDSAVEWSAGGPKPTRDPICQYLLMQMENVGVGNISRGGAIDILQLPVEIAPPPIWHAHRFWAGAARQL